MLNIAIVGVGLVGSELLRQLAASVRPGFKVVAVANSKRQLLSNVDYEPLDLSTWRDDLAKQPENLDPEVALESIAEYLRMSLDPTVVVDNTASEEVARSYRMFLGYGVHVVTPNKKAFSGDLDEYEKLLEEAKKAKRFVYHESTVGAGLPVISTLNDLLRTGDRVVSIMGIFSGTLSYLFNTFSPSGGVSSQKKFSQIIKEAKANGYTEPDPRDDLNGLDVARKVVILGRLVGLKLKLDTLPVENIVPEPLRKLSTADEFLTRLPEYDDHFDALNKKSRDANEVLRYVGVVDPATPTECRVQLLSLPTSHPFASLKGSDNVVAFTTERFPNPLIIQGAGAGAAVTAFGIFADLLKVYERTQKQAMFDDDE